MKKMFALVLALTATTFALDLNLEFQGPESLSIGETATIDIVILAQDNTAQLWGGNMLMNVTGTGDLSLQSGTWGSGFYDVGSEPLPATMLGAEGYYPGFYGPFATITTDSVAYSFDVTATTPGELTIGLYPHGECPPQYGGRETYFGDEYSCTFDGTTTPLTLTVIPEPATLAALLIGSLVFLRRR